MSATVSAATTAQLTVTTRRTLTSHCTKIIQSFILALTTQSGRRYDMAREFARGFYHSQAWRKCQAQYIRQAQGLCERCKERGLIVPGVIVHHRIHLTPNNITDSAVTLSPANLMLLCRDCHAEIHKKNIKRYKVDENGRVTITA